MRLSIFTRKIGSDNKDSIKTDFLNLLFTNTHVLCFLWSFHIRNLLYGKVFYLQSYVFIIFSVWFLLKIHCTQKMKFFIQDFFSKCDQIRSLLRIWSHLLKKSLMENLTFCKRYFQNALIMIMYQSENPFKDVIELFGQVILTKYPLQMVATKFRYLIFRKT